MKKYSVTWVNRIGDVLNEVMDSNEVHEHIEQIGLDSIQSIILIEYEKDNG